MTFSTHIATKDDIDDLAHLHVQGWRDAYGGLLDKEYIESKTAEARKKQWAQWFDDGKIEAIVAYAGRGQPAGFISYGKLKTPPPGMSPIRPLYASEIYAFYILSDYWRHGLGTDLLSQCAQNLSAQKSHSLCLWVHEKNKRAVAFYKKMGGERCGKHDVEFGPTKAREVCFGWRDTSKLINGPE